MMLICSPNNESFDWNSTATSISMLNTGEMQSRKAELWKDPNTVVQGTELIWCDTLHSSSWKFQTHEMDTNWCLLSFTGKLWGVNTSHNSLTNMKQDDSFDGTDGWCPYGRGKETHISTDTVGSISCLQNKVDHRSVPEQKHIKVLPPQEKSI